MRGALETLAPALPWLWCCCLVVRSKELEAVRLRRNESKMKYEFERKLESYAKHEAVLRRKVRAAAAPPIQLQAHTHLSLQPPTASQTDLARHPSHPSPPSACLTVHRWRRPRPPPSGTRRPSSGSPRAGRGAPSTCHRKHVVVHDLVITTTSALCTCIHAYGDVTLESVSL